MTILEEMAIDLADVDADGETLDSSLGYGSDLWCADDVDANVAELAGSNPVVVAQAIYRRLTTPRGSLVDDPSYGIDLASILNKAMTSQDLRDAVLMIKAECLEDDRISDVGLTLEQLTTAHELLLSMRLTLADRTGTFSMTLALTDGALLLSEIAL